MTGMVEWPTGTLWIGTAEGLSRLDLEDGEEGMRWSRTDFGIVRPKVRSLLATADALWFGFQPNREGGIMHFDGTSWRRFSG